MKNRIQIDGVWYVPETTQEQDYDITYSYEATSGIFDYAVLLDEVDDGKRFEININSGFITAYINGRNKDYELWDNVEWLREIRDSVHTRHTEELTIPQLIELRNLLKAVTKKGWL